MYGPVPMVLLFTLFCPAMVLTQSQSIKVLSRLVLVLTANLDLNQIIELAIDCLHPLLRCHVYSNAINIQTL